MNQTFHELLGRYIVGTTERVVHRLDHLGKTFAKMRPGGPRDFHGLSDGRRLWQIRGGAVVDVALQYERSCTAYLPSAACEILIWRTG